MAGFITVSSNIKQAKGLFKELGGTDDVLRSFVSGAAFGAVGEAIRDAPIDLGGLRKNITANYEPQLGQVYALKANVFYAPYVEFGTGEKVKVPTELKAFALQFKGDKKIIGQKHKPYLYPAALRAQTKVVDFIIKWITKQQK